MHLTRVLQPQLCISLAQVAQFLGISPALICRIEHWAQILFVHRADRGGLFLSYRKFAAWVEACAQTIRVCTDLHLLEWLGEVIKAELQRFQYPETTLNYWRQLWSQQHYKLRLQTA
ncbi:hypothetical protein [Leptolyngbya sp. FACHB-261]|uniref:hypothetical protein n=1 Tax=Leptolyngbya sp. FACHB-261 TaxID=2692806 RepID=UPI001683C0CD|nr:hypothetical protein [Leptolyngbya sp. FACHB-261]MBD2102124.1 hypothetical protein [Leptolyngbya sp. FACHB-261]